MQKLAEVCIKRPVFATMIVMALVVVGAASWFRLGVDRFPSVDLPTVTVRIELPGASTEEMETHGLAEARGADQHDPGHRGAALDLQPRQLHRHRDLRAEPADRRGRPGRARQGLHRHAQPAARHPAAGHLQDRQRPGAGDHHRALGRPLDARADRDRRQDGARSVLERSTGVGEVRLVGGPAALGQRLGRRRPPGRLPDADHRRARRAGPPERRPAGRQRDGRAATRPRCARWAASPTPRGSTTWWWPRSTACRSACSDIGYAEDGTKEQRSAARLNGVPTVILEVRRQSGENTVAVIEGVQEPSCARLRGADARPT